MRNSLTKVVQRACLGAFLFVGCVVVEQAQARDFLARTVLDRVLVYKTSESSTPFAYLKKDSSVLVLARAPDDSWVYVEMPKSDGAKTRGYIKLDHAELNSVLVPVSDVNEAHQLRHEHRDEGEDEHESFSRWSFGAGFSGYSSGAGTSVVVGGELRYLWTRDLESIFGLDVSFGSNPALGLRLAQRYYVPLKKTFRPYIHAGFRMANIKEWSSSAFDPGLGVQFVLSGNSYFDIGFNYLLVRPFNADAENIFVFGGSSGIRF